jgi:hypothetical protein
MNKNGRSRKSFLGPGKRKQQKKLPGTWNRKQQKMLPGILEMGAPENAFWDLGNGSNRKCFLILETEAAGKLPRTWDTKATEKTSGND